MKRNSLPVALVTGSARGLGNYLALELSREGYALALHYRRGKSGAERVARAIRSEGGQA